jgi:hypothetical protein
MSVSANLHGLETVEVHDLGVANGRPFTSLHFRSKDGSTFDVFLPYRDVTAIRAALDAYEAAPLAVAAE